MILKKTLIETNSFQLYRTVSQFCWLKVCDVILNWHRINQTWLKNWLSNFQTKKNQYLKQSYNFN